MTEQNSTKLPWPVAAAALLQPMKRSEKSELPKPDISVVSWRPHRFRVNQGFSVYDRVLGVWIRVEAGTIIDLASAPRWLWWRVSFLDLGLVAPSVHDDTYSKLGKVSDERTLTRKECDQVFHRLMIKEGVSRYRAWTAYRAVRAFGWVPWNRVKKGRAA